MDPMALLDMERRTGISHEEVDDFAKRMDLISEAMEQIRNGTFDPVHCKIPGYKTPEQEELERQERLRQEEERKRKEAERKQRAKEEEREQWWRKANLRFAIEDDSEDTTQHPPSAHASVAASAAKWANRVLAAYKTRDANDYSVWDNWVPEDPVTLEEKAAREAALEKVRNEEFERNNPDFCQQFKDDLEKRQKSQRDREREADKLKHQGNQFYKRRDYETAIRHYMQALERSPFNVAILTNVAQCYLRLEALDDSVEFSTRAIFVNPNHVKALSRRAAVWHRQMRLKEAAADMEKARGLAPDNEDIVEQHSIVVGDYEDSLKQRELDDQMARSSTVSSSPAAGQLRFLVELLAKMDEQDGQDANVPNDPVNPSNMSTSSVKTAWMAYELMVPFLERNPDARALFRTSSGMENLIRRLLEVFSELDTLVVEWSNPHDNSATASLHMQQQLTVEAMIHCMAASMIDSPRNQVVAFRNVAIRQQLLKCLEQELFSSLPIALQQRVLQVWEEAIDTKSWRQLLSNSSLGLSTLLLVISEAVDRNRPQHDVEASMSAILSSSSVLFTISSDETGLKTLMTMKAACPTTVAAALETHQANANILTNLLGLTTNLSTNEAFRASLEIAHGPTATTRARFVRSLLSIAASSVADFTAHHTPGSKLCAERAVACLLNFTFQPESLVRVELATSSTVECLLGVLLAVTAANATSLLLVISRTVSLLCRLHSVPDSAPSTDVHQTLSSREVLDALYKICQFTLSTRELRHARASDLWQTHAQIWCHVGWCVALNGEVRAYLRGNAILPAMLDTIATLNADKGYRRSASDSPGPQERVVGNIVKVLIAMVAQDDDHLLTRSSSLELLVVALRELPDGLARKNVAILLAKLCQLGEGVKDRVRALRGIEIMLSVSRSLASPKDRHGERHAVAY